MAQGAPPEITGEQFAVGKFAPCRDSTQHIPITGPRSAEFHAHMGAVSFTWTVTSRGRGFLGRESLGPESGVWGTWQSIN